MNKIVVAFAGVLAAAGIASADTFDRYGDAAPEQARVETFDRTTTGTVMADPASALDRASDAAFGAAQEKGFGVSPWFITNMR